MAKTVSVSSQYDKIAELCYTQGISVTAMSKRAGLSSATMPNLKSGKVQTLSIGTCKRIAAVLNINPLDIYTMDLTKSTTQLDADLQQLGSSLREQLSTEEEQEDDDVAEALLRNSIRDLVLVCRTMYDDDIEKLIQIAQVLKG